MRPRHHEKWRPFKEGLSERSIRHATVIVSGMCKWLTDMGYLATNPWIGVNLDRLRNEAIGELKDRTDEGGFDGNHQGAGDNRLNIDIGRSLSLEQIETVGELCDQWAEVGEGIELDRLARQRFVFFFLCSPGCGCLSLRN